MATESKSDFVLFAHNPWKKLIEYFCSDSRKFCDFCKCWIADNKPSIDFHEGGKKHKENVSKRLKEIHKNNAKQAKQNKKFEDDLRKMENAAMAAYLKDVENNTKDMTADRIMKEKLKRLEENNDAHQGSKGVAVGTPETNPRHGPRNQRRTIPEEMDPCDPMSHLKSVAGQSQSQSQSQSPPQLQQQAKLFHRKNSENRTQGKSKSAKGRGKGNKKNHEEKHPGKPIRKVWYEAFSPEGYAYYWHIETNESVWEPPDEGYMTLAEQEEEAKERAIQEEFFEQLAQEEEKGKSQLLEEQRANEERERLKMLRKRQEEDTEGQRERGRTSAESEIQGNSQAPSDKEERRPYRRDYSVPIEPQLPARRGWQIVRTTPRKPVDLQLPTQKMQVPVSTFEKTEPPAVQRVFKEKTISQIRTGDSDDEGSSSSTFKRRKIGNKSVRKRTVDD